MGTRSIAIRSSRARRVGGVVGVIGLAVLAGGVPSAFAETYEDPTDLRLFGVGTNGDNGYSDGNSQRISISHGGCGHGPYVGIAVGGSCSGAGAIGIGLLGAGGGGWVGVSESGSTTSYCTNTFVTGGCYGGVALSVTGPAYGQPTTGLPVPAVAVSATGNADSPNGIAVSGTGSASGATAISVVDLLPSP